MLASSGNGQNIDSSMVNTHIKLPQHDFGRKPCQKIVAIPLV